MGQSSQMGQAGRYTEEDIVVLEGLDPVRKRPGMYIGGVDSRGYHHLLWEILDNSIDEVMNGYATTISVTLHRDCRSATVEDNGRGIPIGMLPKYGKSALEVILTTLHSGGKFQQGSYTHSGGLHGVGASVVNALSADLRVRIRRDGKEVEQEYQRGVAVTPLRQVGSSRGTGSRVFFRPDPEMFGEKACFDKELVRERLESKSYLHKGLRIVFIDEETGEKIEMSHQGGIADYLQKWATEQNRPMLCPPAYFVRDGEGDGNGLRFELAFVWTESTDETVKSFVNGIPTPSGGTHENGFKSGMNKGVRNYMDTHSLVPKGVQIIAEDIREGLLTILSLYLHEPQFQGQTKERLNNPEVTAEVDGSLRAFVEKWLNANQQTAETIVTRIIAAARAREAMKAANQSIPRKSVVGQRLNLPGKLADCSSSDSKQTELFIVEGDSAGGSAKQGRNRKTQAILPLRGKVLNAEQASSSKLLSNKELQDIVAALGCGMGDKYDESRLRYGRIFLLMDADSDGHHISTLLLTFLYRQMPKLIENGHVFLAQPPLYRIDIGKETHWVLSDKQKDELLSKQKPGAKVDIQRFKGLGEMMPQQLWATTLDPKRRIALRVNVTDRETTDRVLGELMGKDPSARFRFIMEHASEAHALDV
ncbi:MAG TPA: DNA topoisomerase IV subunit B [Pseudomonadota bacterium]|nr:DNA topoisomerase IV subunit B [Pseudomonadota bacterium]